MYTVFYPYNSFPHPRFSLPYGIFRVPHGIGAIALRIKEQ